MRESKPDSTTKLNALHTSHSIPLIVKNKSITCLAPLATWQWKIHPQRRFSLFHQTFWDNVFKNLVVSQTPLTLKALKLSNTPAPSYKLTIQSNSTGDQASQIVLMQTVDNSSKTVKNFTIKESKKDDITYLYEAKTSDIIWFQAKALSSTNKPLFSSNRIPVFNDRQSRELSFSQNSWQQLAKLAEWTDGNHLVEEDALSMKQLLYNLPFRKLSEKKIQTPDYQYELILITIAVIMLAIEWFLRRLEQENS